MYYHGLSKSAKQTVCFCIRGFVVVFKAAAVRFFKDARKKNKRTLEVILERQPGRYPIPLLGRVY